MLKIAITGPESTGKSWLSKQLAAHYEAAWVPEYAREYLANLGRPYGSGDIVKIAQGQATLETRIAEEQKPDILFCDTEILVCKIWQEYKYQKVDPWIEKAFQERAYDVFLLCNIDLAWEDDPLREHNETEDRKALFELYHHHLTAAKKNFVVINGFGDNRLQQAIQVVDALTTS